MRGKDLKGVGTAALPSFLHFVTTKYLPILASFRMFCTNMAPKETN